MKIYKIFSDYCDTPTMTNALFLSFRLKESNRYGKDYVFTLDNNFTHAILINKASPDLNSIPKENVIGLSYEPPVFLQLTPNFIDYVKKHVYKYYIGKIQDNLPPEFIEKYSYLTYNSEIKLVPKTKLMSIIFSNKQWTQQHVYRHQLVEQILKSKLPVDIYGFGCIGLTSDDTRIKGSFSKTEPYDGYMFHITIENVSIPEYFSEKITQALVSKCVPIYLGCTHIDNYFPNMLYKLTGNIRDDMMLIETICNSANEHYTAKPIDVEYVKNVCNIDNLL